MIILEKTNTQTTDKTIHRSNPGRTHSLPHPNTGHMEVRSAAKRSKFHKLLLLTCAHITSMRAKKRGLEDWPPGTEGVVLPSWAHHRLVLNRRQCCLLDNTGFKMISCLITNMVFVNKSLVKQLYRLSSAWKFHI
ncbi:unnamed protein product [Linum trigynum]|uniref:Uncharacterized protein n=1 Tax=Linum trigynum TaxID=586398 RepID=A0AAV2ELY4_9ROSI